VQDKSRRELVDLKGAKGQKMFFEKKMLMPKVSLNVRNLLFFNFIPKKKLKKK
jgi:hypothetical protein